MSAERAELLSVFQGAARIERDALIGARTQIVSLLDECNEPYEYPRMSALDAEIAEIERTITQREIRIDALLAKEQRKSAEPERLGLLLAWQADAQEDRAALVDARDALPDDGDGEDERFGALTREIASVDSEIAARAEEIETLAALARV